MISRRRGGVRNMNPESRIHLNWNLKTRVTGPMNRSDRARETDLRRSPSSRALATRSFNSKTIIQSCNRQRNTGDPNRNRDMRESLSGRSQTRPARSIRRHRSNPEPSPWNHSPSRDDGGGRSLRNLRAQEGRGDEEPKKSNQIEETRFRSKRIALGDGEK
jgi:hypothetical protein